MPDFSGVEGGASSAQSDLARAMFQPQAIPAQPVNTGFFHDVEPDGPAEAGKPYGFPDGQQTPAQARGVRVALGAESPRLTERIAPESEGLAGTLGDMAQDVENVVRGIPSGGITGTGTFAADALGGTAFLPQNLGGTLARLALHQPVPELAGRDAARALTEGVAAPVRAFFQPEGTAGVVGEQVGALAVPGAALKGLAGLRALKAERDAARALESETLDRIARAPEEGAAFRQAADVRAGERQAAVEAYLREHPPTVGEDAGIRRGKPLVTPPPQERKLLTAGEPVRPSRPSAFGESRLDKLRTIMGERRAPVESPVPAPKASAPVRESELASLSDPDVATIRPTVIRGRRVFMGGAPRFRMTEDDALLARRRELLDRLDQAQEDIGKGTFEYVREDANSSGTERPVVWVGRKVTNEAGRAMGALKRDADLIAELDAELKGRGWNYEAIDRHMPASEASRLRSMREAARLDQVEANMRTRESLRQTARAEEEARAERYGIASEAEPVGAGATDFDPSRFGGARLRTVGALASTGAGAATGAAADKDHPVRGAILGGALGLGAGLTAAGIASRAGRRGGVVMEAEPIPEAPSGPTTQQAIDDLLASVRPNAAARLKTEASAGEGIRQGPARPDTDQFVNVAKFSFTDPSGAQRLRQTVSHMVERGNLAPKGRVTWDQVKAEAAKLGLNPEALSRKKAVRMRGPDLLAIRNIVSDNLDAIERMGKQLVEGGSLTKAERATLASKMNALDAQNMNLLDKFTAARTQAGRDLNNLKIVAMRSNDPVAWEARAMQWAGKPLEPDTRALIHQLAREGKVAEYLKLMQSLKQSGTLEKIGTFWRANLLTNPLTHVVNTTSNAGLAALETAKDVPGSIFDRLLSLSTTQRTLSAPSLAQAKAGLAGARQGLREAVQVMKGIPLDEALQKFDFGHDVNFGNGPAGKIFNAYVQVPFRALGAADRVFKVAAVRYSLANQAEARGVNVASILANPPEDMMVQAVLDAAQATVQDQTTIGHLLRSVSKAGGGAGVFVVPFSRTPGAVATRAAEYTPIGFVTGGIKASKAIRAARAAIREGRAVDALTLADQREAAKLLGRATTGAGVIALGYWLADHGLMRGAEGEETAAERDTRYLTGTPEGAVKVGNTWASFGRLSPVGILLSVGANLHSIAKEGTTPDAAAASMAGTVAQAVTDQPFLTGIKNVIDIAQHPTQFSTAQKLGGDIATGFLPASAALGAVARGTDSYIRDAKGIREKLQSRIPGQAKKLDPLLDQFGQPVRREGGLTDALVNPFKRTTDRTFDPVLKEIDRLGVTISRRKPGGTRDRQVTRDLVAFEGPILYDQLAKLLQSPVYQRVNDAGKKALLERKIVTLRGQATRAQQDYLDQQAGVR